MSNLCKHFSGGVKSEPTNVIQSVAKNLGDRPNGKNIAVAILLATALTACNNEESFDMPDAGKLSINVGVNHPTSRSLITAATLPDGDTGAIGVMLTDGDGTLTDYDVYTNVKFTGTTASGSQKWTGATDVLLTENPGTLYAYYPWKDGTDLSAIAIETASQTDYLYATPVTGISETKSNADVAMNHVLTNINLSFADGTYAGVGNITSVSVNGDGIATGGTFNAAQETPGFVADSYTGVGDAITNTTATTLGGNAIDIMVVSNDAEKPITIAATIDGVEYTATTTAVELAKGNSYQYTLTLNSTFMSVSKVSVTPWNNVVKDNLTLEKYVDTTPHVYAVSSTGSLIDYNSADATALGVVLVAGEHKFMIAKSDATDGTNTKLYWGKNLSGKDVAGVKNNSKVDGTNSNGYLGGTSTPQLNKDFTTWTAGALSEFNGKANTAAIINGYTEHGVSMDARDMCTVLNTFNAADSYSDWYVPACGQLALMYLNMTEINAALAKIGGTALAADYFWSSSESSSDYAWFVYFGNGYVNNGRKVSNGCGRVRFVRDI